MSCPTCYLEKQKAQHRAEKLTAAIEAAKILAHESGQTIAIIKTGPFYEQIPVGDIQPGQNIIEYISRHQ